MSWLSKQLKRTTKILDPLGAKIRKETGGSYGDPLNQYQSGPKPVVPYERPARPGLQADPGTGGPTVQLGGPGNGNYTPNPFAGQMAQVAALRAPQGGAPLPGGAPMGGAPMPGGMPPAGIPQMAPQGGQMRIPQTPRMAF